MGKLIYKNERERVGGQPAEDLRSGGSISKGPLPPFNQAAGEKEARKKNNPDLSMEIIQSSCFRFQALQIHPEGIIDLVKKKIKKKVKNC